MLGSIKYVTEEVDFIQPRPSLVGEEFEEYIFQYVQSSLREYYSQGLRIHHTPEKRDGGRDIIVYSKVDFQLFGLSFSLNGKAEICVHFELKSSSSYKISLEKFAKNILAANRSNIEYFVLVTNTTIGPFSYFEAQQNAANCGYTFYLVDFPIIYNCLHDLSDKDLNEIKLTICYQLDYLMREGKPYINIYMLFVNRSDKNQLCHFQLRSDRNFKLTDTQFDVFLPPFSGECKRIGVVKEHFDGIDDIIVSVDYENERKSVVINGKYVDYAYEAPLTGQAHRKIIYDIIDQIRASNRMQFFCLRGEAGIGKSRIIHEVTKELTENGYTIFHYTCSSLRNKPAIDDVLSWLSGKLSKHGIIKQLEDIAKLRIGFYRYVVIIEDLHNADYSLYKQLKDLVSELSEIPIAFILSGRYDLSVNNDSYFAFHTWLQKQATCTDSLHLFPVRKFTNAECKELISHILKEAPNGVVERIQERSENNPFYVIQFVEYLLDTSIVYLINRSTVGITNVSAFSENIVSIPKSVDNILAKRIDVLQNRVMGPEYILLMYSICLYGNNMPMNLVDRFCQYLWNPLEVMPLIENHLLTFNNDGTLRFAHENIYDFMKSKLRDRETFQNVSKVLVNQFGFYNHFPLISKAAILFFSGKDKQCEKLLTLPIREIAQIANISACNLTANYGDSYPIIYEIYKSRKDQIMMRKTLLASMYVALHNRIWGEGYKTLTSVGELINREHRNDITLILSLKQMQAHLFQKGDRISEAQSLLIELTAHERGAPLDFDDETRFDLYDRLTSLYIHQNHRYVAEQYNRLAYLIAEKMQDNRLLALSKIMEAKLNFYSDIDRTQNLMLEAQHLLDSEKLVRLSCHNRIGLLTAQIIQDYPNQKKLIQLKRECEKLLDLAIEVEYPSAIMRCHYLLALLYYCTAISPEEIDCALKHIDLGINDSIYNGSAKFSALFYCLKGTIFMNMHTDSKTTFSYFQTMIQHMRRSAQLFLGTLDFLSSNIIMLTNYAIFLSEYGLESELYQFMSELQYYGSENQCDFRCSNDRHCYYSCKNSIEVFKTNYKSLQTGHLLFMPPNVSYTIKDRNTPLYLVIGV